MTSKPFGVAVCASQLFRFIVGEAQELYVAKFRVHWSGSHPIRVLPFRCVEARLRIGHEDLVCEVFQRPGLPQIISSWLEQCRRRIMWISLRMLGVSP